MNERARSSSSSGCEGGSLRRPKSLGVVTSPAPKCQCQTRLTSTRAVSGLRGSTMARASSSRPLPFWNGLRSAPARTLRNCRGTGLAGPAGVAAEEDMRIDRLGCVAHDHRPGNDRPRSRSWRLRLSSAASSALGSAFLRFRVPRPGLADWRQVLLRRLDRAGEDAVERVVVLAGDRIELVVMAPGAADGQTEQPPADQVDPIVDDLVLIVEEPAADREETHRRQRARVSPQVELVGGDLLKQEPVEGHVRVEGPDHVVAVGVGEGVFSFLREDIALGVGVSGHVQPVPAPPFAVERRGKQPLNHPRKRIRSLVGLERIDLLGGRRNAQEVDRRPADQGPPVGRRRRREALFLEPGQNERVDRRAEPAGILDPGRSGRRKGAKAQCRGLARRTVQPRRSPGARVAPGRSHLHPPPQRRDAGPGSLALGGILSSSWVCSTAWTRRLSAGLPGTTAGPLSPPLRIASRLSSRSPDDCFCGPWHFWQDSTRTGRIAVSKNSTAAVRTGARRQPPFAPATRERCRQNRADQPEHRSRVLMREDTEGSARDQGGKAARIRSGGARPHFQSPSMIRNSPFRATENFFVDRLADTITMWTDQSVRSREFFHERHSREEVEAMPL